MGRVIASKASGVAFSNTSLVQCDRTHLAAFQNANIHLDTQASPKQRLQIHMLHLLVEYCCLVFVGGSLEEVMLTPKYTLMLSFTGTCIVIRDLLIAP